MEVTAGHTGLTATGVKGAVPGMSAPWRRGVGFDPVPVAGTRLVRSVARRAWGYRVGKARAKAAQIKSHAQFSDLDLLRTDKASDASLAVSDLAKLNFKGFVDSSAAAGSRAGGEV